MVAKDNLKLSVIVTAHNEGLLAHKTMLSIFRSLRPVELEGISYEIIVHIDNGDQATIDYYDQYKDDKRFRIFQNSFGDPALSRNFAVTKAKGEYISFADSDDLVSENWYLGGIKALDSQTDQKTVVHANVNLTFGVNVDEPVIQFNQPSSDRQTNAISMLSENNWHSFIMGPRKIFLDFPYPETKNGYGHEDYTFNTNTLNAGIKHDVVEKSILFYRQKNSSVSIANNSSGAVQPYSELYDLEYFKSFPQTSDKKQKKRLLYRAYKAIRNNDFLNYFITPVAKATKKAIEKTRKTTTRNFSQDIGFVIDEWKKINVIENLLYPTRGRLKNLKEYSPLEYLPVARAYTELARQFTKKPDYVFIVPWIIRGGADKALLNYTKAITELHPDWHITIITTLKAKNAWKNKLAGNVDVLDFGKVSASLYEEEKEKLFSRLIVQLGCKRIHIINSEYAYLWSIRHEELLEKEFNLRVSLFSRFTKSFDEKNGIFNYATYAAEIYPAIKKIYTDNKNVIDVLNQYEGFSKDKCFVHYQPVDIKTKPVEIKQHTGKLNILWASRVSEEKRPELLKSIAKQLDPEEFHIDVYGTLEPKYRTSFFDRLSALSYCGEYDGATSLPIKDHDVFLYTSGIDGMPNVVLEMAALGLPVITGDAGGVKEFIKDKQTGLFVTKDDVEGFISALKFAKNNRTLMQEYAEKAQELLKNRHSWESFVETIKKTI